MSNELKELKDLKAKELKVIATEANIAFGKNDNKTIMLKLLEESGITEIPKTEDDGVIKDNDLDSDDSKNIDSKFTIVTNVKRNGKTYVQGDSIEDFDGIEDLIKDGVIKVSK